MIILQNVCKYYDKKQTGLHDVSLHIEKGTFVSVIGPSGAGKSTMLRCINGMLPVTSGTIVVEGMHITHNSKRQLRYIQRNIGMIFQNFCLVKESTTIQNVINARLYDYPFWRMLTGCFSENVRNEAITCLRQVGLEDKAFQKASLLSGGEQQRTAIARSLMQHCTVLLADEPVASLDPVNALQILDLLKKMQIEQNMTIVMNSHHVEQAVRVSDRIIGMNNGRIVFDGTPALLTSDKLELIYGKESSK